MTSTIVYLALRLALGLVCLWSGVDKALSIRAFHDGVARYRLLPAQAAAPVGTAIVVTELASGLCLLTGLAAWLGALGSSALFAAFTVALIVNLVRGNHVACHCFGYSEIERVSTISAARALLLLVLSAVTFSASLSRIPAAPWQIVLPCLVLAATFAMALRLVTLAPQAWSYLTATAVIMPTRRHRVSFKHTPYDRPMAILRSHDGQDRLVYSWPSGRRDGGRST